MASFFLYTIAHWLIKKAHYSKYTHVKAHSNKQKSHLIFSNRIVPVCHMADGDYLFIYLSLTLGGLTLKIINIPIEL